MVILKNLSNLVRLISLRIMFFSESLNFKYTCFGQMIGKSKTILGGPNRSVLTYRIPA